MRKKWIECGFSDFIDGMFGNAGQNIYVSKKGRLQRIFRYDFNKDGYVDVAYGNSQDMGERPDITVVNKPLVNDEIIYLPTQGAFAGICIDLNGDGNDDLVIANQNNGTHTDVPAFVYYGSDRGITGKYRIELPAPNSFDVTAGDFRGIGLKDLAFSSDGRIRVFSYKEQGYYECDFYDVDIGCRVLFVDSGDVNNDGYDDLYVRTAEGRMFILWGSEKGLDAENFSELSFTTDPVEIRTGSTEARMLWNNTWRPCIVELGGKRLLYSTGNNRAVFYKVEGTKITEEFSIDIKGTVYALSADCMNSGYNDLVLCVCEDIEKTEESYIFKGNDKGIDPNDFIKFEACSLRSVAVDDIDGDGNKELVLCQGKNGILYSVDTPVYRIIDKKVSKIVNYVSHDAIDVFCATSKLNKQIVYINHESGRIRGDVEFNVFYNGPDGFNENKKDILDTWAGTDTICCDFNDNGFHDLVICNCAENSVSQGIDPGSFLFHGGPDGFKKECKTVFPTLRAHGCAVGDFRRSGYLDIAFGGFHNPCIKIFKGDEKGFDLSNPQKIVLDPKLDESYEAAPPSRLIFSDKNSEKLDTDYCEVRFLMAADLNNDGFLDLCVSQIIGDYFIILWGGPNGFSRDNMTRLPVVNSVCSQVADLNNDGWPDLIIGGYMYKSKKWTKDSCVTIF